MRSFARSVLSSARVKSSANQSVTATPSTNFVVRRSANSGWAATSVVPEICGSWRVDEHAVLRDDEVGLDVVRALLHGELVGGQRVLRAVAGRAAMTDHERLVVAGLGGGGRCCEGQHDQRGAKYGCSHGRAFNCPRGDDA